MTIPTLGDQLEQPPSDADRTLLTGALEQQRKLIPAEPCEGVRGPRDLGEAARDFLEQVIAGAVAEAVVDLLEAIEVDEQHREHLFGSVGAGERLVEAIPKERAVRKVGETVVKCLMRELLFEPNSLRDVTCVEHDTAHVPLSLKIGDVRLHVAPFSELVLDSEHHLMRLSLSERCLDQRSIIGIDEAHKPTTDDVFLRAPEHAEHRLARVAALAVAEDEHEICRGRDEAAEVRGLAPGCGDQPPGKQQERR
jgi:hypothetical protein